MNIINERSEPDKVLRETINKQLIELFGIDSVTGLCMWRVSWADDQYEKRHGKFDDYTPGGVYLRTVTETREVPKYPYLRGKYVLEHLVGIPDVSAHELPGQRMSYEPIFPFWNVKGDYLPPRLDICKLVVDTVMAAMGKASLRKYVDPEVGDENGLETRRKQVEEIQAYLYGNETPVGDALSTGEGVFIDSSKQLN